MGMRRKGRGVESILLRDGGGEKKKYGDEARKRERRGRGGACPTNKK